MVVCFRDRQGLGGTISDSLEVDYSGRWQEDVETLVADMVAAQNDGNQLFDGYDADSHLLLELPLVAPIIEVQRVVESDD